MLGDNIKVSMSIDLLQNSIDDLKTYWRKFASTLELKTSVSVTQRHRMVATSLDIIAFSDIFIESHNRHLVIEKNQFARTKNMSSEELLEDWRVNSDLVINSLNRLIVSYKVMYFFIRSLQDAIYGVLLELIGQNAGRYSSMKRCVSKKDNPIHQKISHTIPKYIDWFKEFRNQRNKIKYGITAGGGFDPSSDLITINMHTVKEDANPTLIDIDFILSSEDIIKAIEMSVALLKFGDNLVVEIVHDTM